MFIRLKWLYICVAFFLVAGSAHAVEIAPREPEVETLMHGRTRIGLNGGPVIKYTYLDDHFALLMGGRGGISFNDLFVIGGGGYSLVNEIRVPYSSAPYEQYLSFGYGGVMFEVLLASHKMVHLSIHTLIGGGNLYYHDYYWRDWGDDIFFIAEPGMDLELNITRCFRIGLGGTYRFVNGIDVPEYSDHDMSGFSAAMTFKFGRF